MIPLLSLHNFAVFESNSSLMRRVSSIGMLATRSKTLPFLSNHKDLAYNFTRITKACEFIASSFGQTHSDFPRERWQFTSAIHLNHRSTHQSVAVIIKQLQGTGNKVLSFLSRRALRANLIRHFHVCQRLFVYLCSLASV